MDKKEIGYCKDCKWWDGEESTVTYFHDTLEYGACSNDSKIYYVEGFSSSCIGVENDCLVYRDGEGYRADHETGANFGCIHWEVRE